MRNGYYLFAINGDGGQSYLALREKARDELKKIFFGTIGDYNVASEQQKSEEADRWSRFCDPDNWSRMADYASWTDKGEDYTLKVYEVDDREGPLAVLAQIVQAYGDGMTFPRNGFTDAVESILRKGELIDG